MSTTSQSTMLPSLASTLLPYIHYSLKNPTAQSFQLMLTLIGPRIQWIDFQNEVLRQLGLYFGTVNKTRATVRRKIMGDWLVTFDQHWIRQQQQIEDVKDALKYLASARTTLNSVPSMKQSEWQRDLGIYNSHLEKWNVGKGHPTIETYRFIDKTIFYTPAVDSNAHRILTHTRPQLLCPGMMMSRCANLNPAKRREAFVLAIELWEICLGREATSPEFVNAHKQLVLLCADCSAAVTQCSATGDPRLEANVVDRSMGATRTVPSVHDSEMTDQAMHGARGIQDTNIPEEAPATAQTVPNIQHTDVADQTEGAARVVPSVNDTEMTDQPTGAAQNVPGTEDTYMESQDTATSPQAPGIHDINIPEQSPITLPTVQPSLNLDITEEDIEAANILVSMKHDTRYLRQLQDQHAEMDEDEDAILNKAIIETVRGMNARIARDAGE